ncbi:MAG: nucleotide exchange factor GrpE [Clostridiales bacterium]|nr:nucleotide exchange factor GrpE [Clostridiales bacterium]
MTDDENEVLEFPEDDEPTIDDIDLEQDPEDEEEDEELEAGADESARIKELEDRYVRLFAEYDNFRKRTAKEKEDLYASAVVEVTKQWLSVLDNIDRALDAAKAAAAKDGEVDETEDKMLQGLELIKKQAADVLAKINVTEIECERGTAFDPNLHEAVMHTEDDSLGENEVAQVFQKGYILKDRVVRHAVVQVAN